ncbi:MAG: T9SS type A sorting domain-containing protein [Rhodothermales bacterium]|nr:T9SS type A sorting domain-containing protein [Rhodothermales bacterium]
MIIKTTVSHLYRLAVAAIFAGTFLLGPSAQAQIKVPIEVIGPDGYTQSVNVNVTSASEVSRLWLQVHSPGYKYGEGNKMSVRINGGAWTDVNNQIAICEAPESSYECIGGAFATVRFTIPATGVISGNNTIDFRFNGTEGLTIGYRVLAFNFVRSDNSKILPESTFYYDDPSLWTAPLTSQSDIDRGKQLWESEPLLDFGNVSITATCADCHAKDGRDLQYFAYSNHSIIERSKFHGMSQTEGEQVASYIRNLAVASHGTPWDPPYQPGPGLDDKPAEEWAAGAGLEWVLEEDEQMIPHMFPDGFSSDQILTSNDLNMREIPIGIQLPDWNEWLPRVHPKDAWGSVFTTSSVYTIYATSIPSTLAGGVQNAINSGSILSVMDSWGAAIRDGRGSSTFNPDFFGGWGSDGTVADYQLGYQQWQAVKTWEIMNTYEGLQEAAPTLYPGVGEARSWFGNTRSVFDVAPHISGPPQTGSYPHGDPLQNFFMSSAWYELQLILNSGNRNGVSIRPHDWKYHYGHIGDIMKESGRREPMRHLKAYAKNMQMADNRYGVGTANGFYLRHVTPSRMVGTPGAKNPFEDLDSATRRAVTEPILRALVVKLLEHDISEWSRQTGLYGIEPASTVPTPGNGFDTSTYIDHFYHAIPVFNSIGVAPTLLDSLATWAESAWPLGDWHSLYDYNQSNNPPSITLTSPANGTTYTEPATIAMSASASDIDGSVVSVKFFQNGIQIHEDNSAPYSYTWSGVVPGTYTISALAEDNSSATAVSGSVSVTVNSDNPGPPPSNNDPTVAITSPLAGASYDEGDNIVIEANASDSDGSVSVVQFYQNNILLGQDTSAPYSFTWSNVQEGAYALSAVATDNDGASTTSNSIVVTAGDNPGPPPTITETQTIDLVVGWNQVSTYVAPQVSEIASIFQPIVSDIFLVKDVVGNSYHPALGINTIENWNSLESYQVYANAASTFDVEGAVLDPSTTAVPIVEGWNYIPYLRKTNMSIDEALVNVTSDVVMVKDYAGRVYFPDFQINEIGDLEPGQGYKLFVNSGGTLTYPANAAGVASRSKEESGQVLVGIASSSLVVVDASKLPGARRVFAVLENGTRIGEAWISSVTNQAYVKVRGDDDVTIDLVEGALNGDRIILEAEFGTGDVKRVSASNIQDILGSNTRSVLSLSYKTDSAYLVELGEIPGDYVLEQNYPNPFNPSTTIRYELPDDEFVKIEVFNMLGERVATLVNEEVSAGSHTATFEADNISSGLYVYRLIAGSYIEDRAMMFLK